MSLTGSEEKAAQSLAKLLKTKIGPGDSDNFGDRSETLYQRKKGSRRQRDEKFCPYIGIRGDRVDLHAEKTFPGYNHVGVKPKQSLGQIIDNGSGGGEG